MIRMTVLAAAALVLVAGAANAAEPDKDARDPAKDAAYAARLFGAPLGKDKSYACFVRRYDAAHLAGHPRQKVKAMKILVSAETVPEAEGQQYGFILNLDIRGRKNSYESSGRCGHLDEMGGAPEKLQLGCGVECDGGGIDIAVAADAKSILVETARVVVWPVGSGPDDEKGFDLGDGGDDKSFRLIRTSLRECRSMIPKDEPRTAMKD